MKRDAGLTGKSPHEASHEILKEAKAALGLGKMEEALREARRAYEACPGVYPANFNALSVALECMEKLDLKEEAEIVRETMRKILYEHDTKPHAERETRAKHPLKKDKHP
ncbi:MAG: hypothetical protein ACE5JS_09220 [Nitrospinota bacterium]